MAIVFNMLRKEFLLNKRFLLFCGLFVTGYSLYLGWRASSSRMFVIFAVLLSVLFALTLNTRTDKFRGDVLNCSLPLSRRTLVLCKYVITVVLALVYLLCSFIAVLLSPLTTVFSRGGLQPVLAAAMVLLVAAILAIFIPLIVRFGYMGLLYVMIGFQVLGVLLFALARLAGPPPLWLRRLLGGVGSFLSGLPSRLGAGLYCALLLALSLVLLVASYALAVFLFKRKEL